MKGASIQVDTVGKPDYRHLVSSFHIDFLVGACHSPRMTYAFHSKRINPGDQLGEVIMAAAYLVMGGRASAMEFDPRGKVDILSGLISKPWAHVFLRLTNPKYHGALAEVVDGQDFSKERLQVRLVLEGETILVKQSAIVIGERRSLVISEAILTIVSIHMLHVNVGQRVERRKIVMGDETIDALGISIYKFHELVHIMADMFAASFERFGPAIAAEQKKGMDALLAIVNDYQRQHGRMLAEIFMLYKTISEESRAKVNKNALDITASFHGKMVDVNGEVVMSDEQKSQVEKVMNDFSNRVGGQVS